MRDNKTFDAGASPNTSSEPARSGEQLDRANTNFENTLILLRQTLMYGFNEAHFVYCNGP
jgi:hypothetical protein